MFGAKYFLKIMENLMNEFEEKIKYEELVARKYECKNGEHS